MPNAQCLMPNAPMPQCPNAQCPMPNAQCPMPNAQCPMPDQYHHQASAAADTELLLCVGETPLTAGGWCLRGALTIILTLTFPLALTRTLTPTLTLTLTLTRCLRGAQPVFGPTGNIDAPLIPFIHWMPRLRDFDLSVWDEVRKEQR